MENYFNYWGKAKPEGDSKARYHLLPFHCLDVAAVGWLLLSDDYSWSRDLAKELGIPAERLRRLLVFFWCLHDIGKFARAFQGQVTGLSDSLVPPIKAMTYNKRHDSLGFWLWLEADEFKRTVVNALSLSITDLRKLRQLDIWFEIVTGHHGQPPEINCPRLEDYYDKSDIQAACDFCSKLAQWWLRPDDSQIFQDKEITRKLKKASWKLAGISVLADWLGSDQSIFEYRSSPECLNQYWTEHALPKAKKVLGKANLNAHKPTPFIGITQIFDFVKIPTPLQRYAITQPILAEPQLFILEDVTGAGKTEAAMVLVHRLLDAGLANGLYVGLPTMATANAMYQRLAVCYQRLYQSNKPPSLVLAHGARHLSSAFSESVALSSQQEDANYSRDEPSASAYCNAWLADSRKKALLADIGVGTIDQALLAILPIRHQSLRLLGLNRKVLLVDEVHAYDPYMKRLLERLLEAHAAQGGSAILLSATLPMKMKSDLSKAYSVGRDLPAPALSSDSFPLATQIPAKGGHYETYVASRKEVSRTVKVERLSNEEAVLQVIEQAIAQDKCVCWLSNTVDRARRAYQQLIDQPWSSKERVHLFHSRFAMQDRQTVETRTLGWFGKFSDHQMRQGRILVSTQVVEQSLDLDFDILISELAPIDLLLQRAGRLQRHVRDKNGNRLDEGSLEQREAAVLYVLSPATNATDGKEWLKEQSGTLAVYQDLGQLWRTANILLDRQAFTMPDDARLLIESVYSHNTEIVTPEAIDQASISAEGKRSADTSMANLNMLDVSKGYSQRSNNIGWGEEVNVPTRLSDKTVSVVLVKPGEHGGWRAYADQEQYGWDYSTLKLSERLWRECENSLPSDLVQQMEVLQAQHKSLKWRKLFPLIDGFECWYHPEKGWVGNSGG